MLLVGSIADKIALYSLEHKVNFVLNNNYLRSKWHGQFEFLQFLFMLMFLIKCWIRNFMNMVWFLKRPKILYSVTVSWQNFLTRQKFLLLSHHESRKKKPRLVRFETTF